MPRRAVLLITIVASFMAAPLAMASPGPAVSTASGVAPSSVRTSVQRLPSPSSANRAVSSPLPYPPSLPTTTASPANPVPASAATVPAAATAATSVTSSVSEAMLTSLPPTSGGQLGVGLALSYTLSRMTSSAVRAELASIRSLGVGWIRVDLDWAAIQPTSPVLFNWSSFDTIVSAAAADGISVLPTIDYTPAWARPSGCSTRFCAPASPMQFAIFAAAAVARYAPWGVHTWEIWNEPNLATFWQPAPNASTYVALLKVTTKLMRTVDPNATIISGGLARAHSGGGSIAPLQYLAQFCAAGGPALVDGIGYHPYSYPAPPDSGWGSNSWQGINQTHPSVESILRSFGAGSKPIWLTEYGAPTGGQGPAATISHLDLAQAPNHVDQALQALMVTQSVVSARSDPHIAALFWYSYQDLGTSTSTVENFFGLRTFAGKPKLAWFAMQKVLRS